MSNLPPLSEYIQIIKEKKDLPLPIYSVTLSNGMQPRDNLGRSVLSELESKDNLFAAKGDICYNMMRMWQGASGLAPEDCHVSPAYVVCRPKENLDPTYASFMLKSQEAIKAFIDRSQGVTSDRWRLYPDEFLKVSLFIPPLPEQKKIAEILSVVDRRIQSGKSLLSKIEDTLQGLRDQTQFGKGRQERIGDLVARITTGTSVSGENRPCNASEHGVLKVSCVSKGEFLPKENKVIVGENKDRATMPVRRGMLLMSRANTPELVGACGITDCDYSNLYLPDKVWNLELADTAECSKEWLNNALNSQVGRSKIRDASTGTSGSMRNISQRNFLETEILVPPIATQKRQSDLIDSLLTKKRMTAVNLEKYLMLKEALSSDLLSGRRRVSV